MSNPTIITDKIAHPAHVPEVGKLCAAWSFFELITDSLLWGILGTSPKIGSMISSTKDLVGRWSLIINHAESIVTSEEYKTLKEINKKLAVVASDRNIIIHGQILFYPENQSSFAIITRGASAGKLHPISQEAVMIVTLNVASLSKLVREICMVHNWLPEEPNGVKVQNWPTPI